VKLVDLAREAIRQLKEHAEEGIRSDVLAEELNSPKRRVYDIIAVLRAMQRVETRRRFDGTTVTWIDDSADFVPSSEFEKVRSDLDNVTEEKRALQVQVAELKESLRITKAKLRLDSRPIEAIDKTEFTTTQLRVRALSSSGVKLVQNSGMEVLVETHDPGMIVDPTERERDSTAALLKSLQKM
jgi:hypothetical protein